MTSTKHLTDTDTFVSYTLVTDSRTFEIVRRTAKSIWIRPTQDAYTVEADGTIVPVAKIKDMSADGANDPGCMPVVWTPQMPNPAAATVRLGLRKDGTFRTADWASPLRPAAVVDGMPCRRTDYRY